MSAIDERPGETSSERLLARAETLLAVDPTRLPPTYRVRWWNIAIASLLVIGVASLVAPIWWPNLQDGLWGNVLAETWGIIATAVLAWMVFKRFRAERFNPAILFSFEDPFRDLRRAAVDLYQALLSGPVEAREVLNDALRSRLRASAETVFHRTALYSRFFELEELARIDACASAASSLAVLDEPGRDPKFMCELIRKVRSLYVYSSRSIQSPVDEKIFQRLTEEHEVWLTKWRSGLES